MKLRFFHAGDGDCALVSSGDLNGGGGPEHHVLVDGGRKGAFQANARKTVAGLPHLDAICVSHIDDDHISGILGLLEDEVEWRIHRFREDEGLDTRKPRVPEPPQVKEIWHNGLFHLVGKDLAPQVEGTLHATANLFAGSPDAELRDYASRVANLAAGERSAMELSRRISDGQLDIPLNRPVGELMVRDTADKFSIGDLEFFTLGPTEESIEKLRGEWQTWIDTNADALKKLQKEMLEDEKDLGTFQRLVFTNSSVAAALGEGESGVSTPNVASLMFLVESGDGSVLFTGDGLSGDILEGLGHHEKLQGADQRIHVSVLKVQHHGALGNVTADFVQRVTADHYVFCGNGAHHNPEREVVEKFALARLTGIDGAAPVGPDEPFRFHFTSSSETKGLSDTRKEHMQLIERTVEEIQDQHDPGGRFSAKFIAKGSLMIEVD